MSKKLIFMFDEEGDVLDIAIGKPVKAISRDVGDDVLIRINPKTKKVVGFTILNFRKRFRGSKLTERIDIPINASFTPG